MVLAQAAREVANLAVIAKRCVIPPPEPQIGIPALVC